MAIPSEISTRINRMKLIGPFLALTALFCMCALMMALIFPAAIESAMEGKIPTLKGLLILISLIVMMTILPWGLFMALRRFISPDEIEISKTGIIVSRLGKQKSYLWSELGPPKERVSARNGRISFIDLQILGSDKNVSLLAAQYNQSFE